MQALARAVALAVLLAAPAPGLGSVAVARSSSSNDEASEKQRPVAKVVHLLKDMLVQLEAEGEEDKEIYDKLVCWCEHNDQAKTKAVADAEAEIVDLTSKIEDLTADSSRLATEIGGLQKELAEDQTALDKATALREKQLAEFTEEEKDLLQSITALKSAVTVLSKHHKEGLFLQMPQSHALGVATALQRELRKHAALLKGVLTPSERRAAAAFIQAPRAYLQAARSSRQSYEPQSGEIFGILRQMQETFEANLGSTQKEEQENSKAYEELKAAKEAEIEAGQDQLDSKTKSLAETDEQNAKSKADLEDTRSQLSADEEFLASLKSKCKTTDEDFERRMSARQTEMEACTKAITVLSSDEGVERNNRVYNPSLLQRAATQHSARQAQASKLLSALAQRLDKPRLAALAYRVRLDAFTRVKKSIDDMIAELVKEKEDEIKHKDFCIAEFQENQLKTEKMEHQKDGLLVKMDDLKALITKLGKEIAALKAEVAEMELQKKRAGEDRERENQEYQAVVADQRASQKDIQAAMKILAPVYGENALSLAQRQEPAPPGFKEYGKNAGGNRVMDMLKDVLADTKKMEDEAIRDEEDMQKAYEDFVTETNKGVDVRSRKIVEKTQAKAKTEKDLLETTEMKDSALLELEQLSTYDAQLHSSCDFVMKNFDVRQTARDEEIEALRTTIRILSGDKMAKFLQTA